MATMKAKYLGQLRVECEHVASGEFGDRSEHQPQEVVSLKLLP